MKNLKIISPNKNTHETLVINAFFVNGLGKLGFCGSPFLKHLQSLIQPCSFFQQLLLPGLKREVTLCAGDRVFLMVPRWEPSGGSHGAQECCQHGPDPPGVNLGHSGSVNEMVLSSFPPSYPSQNSEDR
jgi:hypothetical protein